MDTSTENPQKSPLRRGVKRRVLIGLAIMLTLIGIIILSFSLYESNVRAKLCNWVHEHSGVSLKLNGPLKLHLLPRIGISATNILIQPKVAIVAPKVNLSVDQVKVELDWLALVSGKPKVYGVYIQGAAADICRDKQGRLNLLDLAANLSLGQDTPGSQMSAELAKETDRSSLSATVAALPQIYIEDSALKFIDLSTGVITKMTEGSYSRGYSGNSIKITLVLDELILNHSSGRRNSGGEVDIASYTKNIQAMLNSVNADIQATVRIGSLKGGSLSLLENLRADVVVAEGGRKIDSTMSGKQSEHGEFRIKLKLQSTDQQPLSHVELGIKATKIAIQPILSWANGVKQFGGGLDFSLQLNSPIAELAQMVKNSSGSGKVVICDGYYNVLDFTKGWQALRNLWGNKNQSAIESKSTGLGVKFSAVEAPFTISQGLLVSNPIAISSSNYRGDGKVQIDLATKIMAGELYFYHVKDGVRAMAVKLSNNYLDPSIEIEGLNLLEKDAVENMGKIGTKIGDVLKGIVPNKEKQQKLANGIHSFLGSL